MRVKYCADGVKREMKKVFIFVLTAFILAAATGCGIPNWEANDHLYYLTAYNIFSTENLGHGEWLQEGKLLETDAYGRELYLYRRGFWHSLGFYDSLCIYGICQSYDADQEYVYAYEDMFYIMGESADAFSEEEIEALKAANDWGLPLDETKMTYTDVNRGWEGFARQPSDKAQESIKKHLYRSDRDGYYWDRVEYDSAKDRLLYWVAQYDQEDRNLEKRFYFLITDAEGELIPGLMPEEIEDLYHYQAQLHRLKLQSGWDFSSAPPAAQNTSE